jgi:hypothetical protein
MSYEAALAKAWEELTRLASRGKYSVEFLGDTYGVDFKKRLIRAQGANTPAKEYLAILILHYLAGSLKKSFSPCGEWISFKELEGGEVYFPAFRDSAIKPLLARYGENPEDILSASGRFAVRRFEGGDTGVEVETFKGIWVRIVFWRGDEEFGPEATILFDKNLTGIYSMEDIAVLLRLVVHAVIKGP